MKIAVYTICLNEAKHVEKFMEYAVEADYVVILDTGSVDDSVLRLREAGAIVHERKIDPWRFDDARNCNLELVPEDVDMCFSIDLDEKLPKGWREKAEGAWCPGITRIHYQYSQEGRYPFNHDKFHARHGYEWRHIVHETVYPTKHENFGWALDILVEHWPDNDKSRDSYLPLLEKAVVDDPSSSHHLMWLVNEYTDREMNGEAVFYGCKLLESFPNMWTIHRCMVMDRISLSYRRLGVANQEIQMRENACLEAPGWRDPWLYLARAYNERKMWARVVSAVDQMLSISDYRELAMASEDAWGAEPFMLAAQASANVRKFEDASKYFKRGMRVDPTDKKIADCYGEFLSQNNPDSKN